MSVTATRTMTTVENSVKRTRDMGTSRISWASRSLRENAGADKPVSAPARAARVALRDALPPSVEPVSYSSAGSAGAAESWGCPARVDRWGNRGEPRRPLVNANQEGQVRDPFDRPAASVIRRDHDAVNAEFPQRLPGLAVVSQDHQPCATKALDHSKLVHHESDRLAELHRERLDLRAPLVDRARDVRRCGPGRQRRHETADLGL